MDQQVDPPTYSIFTYCLKHLNDGQLTASSGTQVIGDINRLTNRPKKLKIFERKNILYNATSSPALVAWR